MKEILVEEMKKIQLNILLDIDKFCEKNNIRYYLCGGSLLGAIRHKGFIPWDDDIDICMPRPDYEKFLSTYMNEYYKLFHWKRNNKCLCTFAKVYDNRTLLTENGDFGESLGVNIDVFPVDGLPKDKRKINSTIKKMKILWGLVVCATVKDISKRTKQKKLEIRLMRMIYRLFPIKHFITGIVISSAQKYSFDNSNKVATLVWGYGNKEIIHHKTASEYIKAEFEGHMLNIPRNYEEYLINIFGDYMKLPPKEERIYKHGAQAFWKTNH